MRIIAILIASPSASVTVRWMRLYGWQPYVLLLLLLTRRWIYRKWPKGGTGGGTSGLLTSGWS